MGIERGAGTEVSVYEPPTTNYEPSPNELRVRTSSEPVFRSLLIRLPRAQLIVLVREEVLHVIERGPRGVPVVLVVVGLDFQHQLRALAVQAPLRLFHLVA